MKFPHYNIVIGSPFDLLRASAAVKTGQDGLAVSCVRTSGGSGSGLTLSSDAGELPRSDQE